MQLYCAVTYNKCDKLYWLTARFVAVDCNMELKYGMATEFTDSRIQNIHLCCAVWSSQM
jgi:hypothetical protein